MPGHLKTKNLIPFRQGRNGFRIARINNEEEENLVSKLDPELTPEEQAYIRHYLNYADALLKDSEPPLDLNRREEDKKAGKKAA